MEPILGAPSDERMRLRFSLLLLLALLATLSCERSAPLPRMDRPLALLARPTVAGAILDVTPLEGKVVVVNFWSPG